MRPLVIRHLGLTDYHASLKAMQTFTAQRTAETPDELWLTEHPPVYTLGLNRRNIRLPQNDIPVVECDRGGKITYHGPGQIIVYLLIDLARRKLSVRQLVDVIELSVIALLSSHGVNAYADKQAPGVYIDKKKIASVGLRLKNQCCYHGLSLNVDMDLSPFQAIDPCGYAGLEITQTKDLGIEQTMMQLSQQLLEILQSKLAHD